ncbi:hypothetical protein ACHAPT_005268 [Fusarium lateritium]
MAKSDARARLAAPSPTSPASSNCDNTEWPDNFDATDRQIRSVERIEAVIGQKPWEWLAEFLPKH